MKFQRIGTGFGLLAGSGEREPCLGRGVEREKDVVSEPGSGERMHGFRGLDSEDDGRPVDDARRIVTHDPSGSDGGRMRYFEQYGDGDDSLNWLGATHLSSG